jgi:hypothetical protein
MSDVAGFRLEEEEQVAVLLRLVVVGEEALLEFEAVSKVVGDFILLQASQYSRVVFIACGRTSSNAMRFWISRAIRESR